MTPSLGTLCLVAGALASCASVVTTTPALTNSGPCSLPFRGHLVDSDPSELPPSLTAALADSGNVTLRYREAVEHRHEHVPEGLALILGIPFLLGVPLGTDGVSAHATLSAAVDGRSPTPYRADADVSRRYGLYYGSTFKELDREARRVARQAIDEQVCADPSLAGGASGNH
jgi:hypothetical protein